MMGEVKELKEIIAEMAIEMAKVKRELKASQTLEKYYSECYQKELAKQTQDTIVPNDVSFPNEYVKPAQSSFELHSATADALSIVSPKERDVF